MSESVAVQAIGGPTAVVVYAGLRFLTDPTFDPPHERRQGPSIRVKYAGPVVPAEDVEPSDAVLLSHDHHHDNLDDAGRAFLGRARRVLTTRAGAERLANGAVGLEPFESIELPAPDRRGVTVTATPAEHGPPAHAEENGPVIGFVLQADDLSAVYVSGDNASVEVVREIVGEYGAPDVAVLFCGGAAVPVLWGEGVYLTLTPETAVEAAKALGAAPIIPIHQEGWAHFSFGPEDLRRAFADAGLEDRLREVAPGDEVALG
jgi:L-ascorbate metabolism protein UlaG (beta-lactamase superfamily)